MRCTNFSPLRASSLIKRLADLVEQHLDTQKLRELCAL
jgi:hypothetical protein